METPQWPAKYQQSAPENGTIHDNLSNGNGVHDGDVSTEENTEGALNNYKPDGNETPTISDKARRLIASIQDQMKELSNIEKYLVNLKLFQIGNVIDPLRQPLNPLGSRSEISRTISWIKTHLEEDAETSLPKQQVYEEYSLYCTENQIKSLSQADFGKVMKQVYPNVRARRLGTRGNSRYCYSGLTRCLKLKPPKLPDLGDKPLSTEAPSTQSSLTVAAWAIVKEWSEIHFGIPFSSIQALARFLVITHSVGVGTEAANQVTSATDAQLKSESYGKFGTKHREMQLQLQKKIQQKNEVKERKRKVQSPKCDSKPSNGKKSKASARPEASPTLTCTGESSTSTGTGSTSTSPTQGRTICDKSLDFTATTTISTQLPALPDFKSFQKSVCEQQPAPTTQQQNDSPGAVAKVPIPRLLSGIKIQSPQTPPKKHVKNVKYKTIQPKPQLCDTALYNPQPSVADIGSQGLLHNVDRIKERKSSDDDCDAPVFPLPRERLDSIGNVDKDAMDEYLGANNSQHEEELSKYFSNNVEPPNQQENSTKLFQLRQLLEQNGISENKSLLVVDNSTTANLTNTTIGLSPIHPANATPSAPVHSTLQPSNSHARRRVSFEAPFHQDVVPPSPNTRRKNFSFTPIDPGPHSPNGRQSKSSSTNVSPFVSPRNTPLPRAKSNTHQNAVIRKKIKHEPDLVLEIPADNKALAMSAPASPMCGNSKSLLKNLLNANNKVSYNPNYTNNNLQFKPDTSGEYFEAHNETLSFRSQSVPLNQMARANFSEQFLSQLPHPNPAGDFNDFDPIPETQSVTVENIIDTLEEQHCENPIFGVNLENGPCLPGFNLIVNNNLEIPSEFNYVPCPRNVGRSQSIDVSGCYETKCSNPSRSVPNTPLSFNRSKLPPVKDFANQNSRSYPSTPLLISGAAFNYNGDCLLNGQPIRSNGLNDGGPADNLNYFMSNLNEINEDNNIDRHLTGDDELGRTLQNNDFGDDPVMDENGVLIGEQNYSNPDN